ncbi:MAG: gfo/Idh/MocA family oxidoreductase, partial [Deltaproteobacteria bacterium]|nr:gfo/Idh/MocA family oxidoreductase [Deltaproteobacteria bacterium]
IRFANGCIASVTASRVSNERARKITLFQRDAYIAIDYANQNMAVFRKASPKNGEPLYIMEEDVKIKKNDILLEEIKAFVNSVITRNTPLVSGEDGRRALKVAQMIQRAGKWEVGSGR